MTNPITLCVVATPAVSLDSPLYQDYLLVGDVLQKLEDGSATDAELAEGAAAQDRIETAMAKARAQQQEAIAAECVATETAKAELAQKVDAAIKKVEADIIERFRTGLVNSGGDRVFEDAHQAKELVARLEASLANGNLGAAQAAFKALRQGTIAAGVVHYFGSARKQDEFLCWANGELEALQAEILCKKRKKSRK